jgi:hypothetical protein
MMTRSSSARSVDRKEERRLSNCAQRHSTTSRLIRSFASAREQTEITMLQAASAGHITRRFSNSKQEEATQRLPNVAVTTTSLSPRNTVIFT